MYVPGKIGAAPMMAGDADAEEARSEIRRGRPCWLGVRDDFRNWVTAAA